MKRRIRLFLSFCSIILLIFISFVYVALTQKPDLIQINENNEITIKPEIVVNRLIKLEILEITVILNTKEVSDEMGTTPNEGEELLYVLYSVTNLIDQELSIIPTSVLYYNDKAISADRYFDGQDKIEEFKIDRQVEGQNVLNDTYNYEKRMKYYRKKQNYYILKPQETVYYQTIFSKPISDDQEYGISILNEAIKYPKEIERVDVYNNYKLLK